MGNRPLRIHYFIIVFLLVFFGPAFQVYCQNGDDERNEVLASYTEYFELPRETVFTHFNKTSFLVGESVWFKTYVRDRHLDRVSKATTNVNVGIYDGQGNLRKKDLWLAVNGTANGQILLDSTFTTGDYYIKTSTNWMRNFVEPDDFVQKITVYGNNAKSDTETAINSYDIQFLPEGGHIISNVSNVIGFKVLDKNGKGVKVQGLIYDKDGNEQTNFKSNVFGMGKFFLTPDPSGTYVAEVYLPNGTTQKKELKGIKTTGFNIQVNNLGPKNVIVRAQTNNATFNAIKGKRFMLVIHKNGKMKIVPFQFNEKAEKTLLIPRSDLFNGINILTVFDESYKPVMERLVFNSTFKRSKAEFAISQIKKENDSLVFSIYGLMEQKADSSALSNLSISILPETTQAYNPEHNILSANYLRPYINGTVEGPTYYFSEDTRKVKYDLDLLLLTQGWSRYKWNDILNNTPKPVFDFENGLTLQGSVMKPADVSSLTLQLPKLMGSNFVDLEVKPDRSFTLNKFFPFIGEEIRFSYTDKKGNLKKPNLSVNYLVKETNTELLNSDLIKNTHLLVDQSQPEIILNKDFFYDDNTVELDEVLVTGTNRKKKLTSGVIVPKYTFKDNYTPITEEEIKRFPNILDIIAYNGYSVRRTQDGRILIRNLNPNSPNSDGIPLVFYDGVRIDNFTFLFGLRSNFVEGIIIDRTGLGMGMNGVEGVIRIFSRETPIGNVKTEKPFAFLSKAIKGFAEPKEFYTPKYKSYSSKAFQQYGTIGWLPNVFLLENKSELFKLQDTNTDSISFYIEGYDFNGDLVSKEVKLSLE